MAEPTLLQQARERLLSARIDGCDPAGFAALVGAVDYTLQLIESWVANAVPSTPMSIGYEQQRALVLAAPPMLVHAELAIAPGETFTLPQGSALGDAVTNRSHAVVHLNVVERTVRMEAPSTPSNAADASALDLDALQRLCDAATPGPWEYDPDAKAVSYDVLGHLAGWVCDVHELQIEGARTRERNAAFIAAARDALPKLIAEVKLHREVARARRLWIPASRRNAICPDCNAKRCQTMCGDCRRRFPEAKHG